MLPARGPEADYAGNKDYTHLRLQTAKLPTLNNDLCMSTSNISNHLF
jgi:hypothetical protein